MKEPTDRTALAVRVFDAWASEYDKVFQDTSRYHAAFHRFCDVVTPLHAEVLELGCGPGNVTRYLLQRRPDLRILATDLAPNMLELARGYHLPATFALLDARAISSLGRSFDAIVCGFCLPYFSPAETTAFIRDAFSVLRNKGSLFISTMENDPAKSGYKAPSSGQGESAYIQYYQGEALCKELEGSGFSIRDVMRERYTGRDGAPVTDLMIIAQR